MKKTLKNLFMLLAMSICVQQAIAACYFMDQKDDKMCGTSVPAGLSNNCTATVCATAHYCVAGFEWTACVAAPYTSYCYQHQYQESAGHTCMTWLYGWDVPNSYVPHDCYKIISHWSEGC